MRDLSAFQIAFTFSFPQCVQIAVKVNECTLQCRYYVNIRPYLFYSYGVIC